jgi:hypothetical protein
MPASLRSSLGTLFARCFALGRKLVQIAQGVDGVPARLIGCYWSSRRT